MPKLRSSDSGASSRARSDVPRPISTGAVGVPKPPSSPHSISRMFSTKIRGLLHSRDRRASSPLSPPNVASSIHEAQMISASVPSSPRTTHPPPAPPQPQPQPTTTTTTTTTSTSTVHTAQQVAAKDFEYGEIPISGPCPQKNYPPSMAPSGHSSFVSADSPTTTTETTTDSTGIRSNRSSFQSFQNEKRRSESPSSPITPDGDYQFARTDPEKTDSRDYYNSYEDPQDDARSQEVFVYLDESSVAPDSVIPSVQVEPTTPIVNKHTSQFSSTSPSRIHQPVSRSRSSSPAPHRAPSLIRQETTGRETPSFLTPRPAPIPIQSGGTAKPALHPSERGLKLLRMSTMSSKSSAVNKAKAPLSLTPRVRPNTAVRPPTANRPGTSFSSMSMASHRSVHSQKSPGLSVDNPSDVDENISLPPPHSPCGSTFNPDKVVPTGPPRGKPSSVLREIVIPPSDARSFRTAPVSPTAPSEYSFAVGLSPKRIPDDMQMHPVVFNTEASDADVSIPFFPVQSPVTAEPRRSKTVSLRHAFTRLNSHVNKRGANTHITPDIISRPSSAIKNGVHPLSAEVPQTIQEDNSENAPTTRPRATSGATLPSSFSRWKSGHTRSSSNPSNTQPPLPSTTADVQAVALTDEERSEIARMPGTIFLKTAIARTSDGADGELTIQEHRLKPRKGMQGSGDAGKCRFCRRGPFPNMWVCLDSCGFVMCRVCANESVQNGEAELF